MMRRIAVARLRLPNGEEIKNQVVEWEDAKSPPHHYPLTQELHSTPWYSCTFDLETQEFV